MYRGDDQSRAGAATGVCCMNTGRLSKKALDASLPVAQARGMVIFLLPYPGMPCSFLISCPYGVFAITPRRERCLHAPVEKLAFEHREVIAKLSAAEFSPGIIPELWLWSPYGSMRFFRLRGMELIEIDRTGVPRDPPVTATITGKKKAGPEKPEKKPVSGKPGENILPEKDPGPVAGSRPPDNSPPHAGPGPAGTREPAPVRYLRRLAKEKQKLKDQPAAIGKEKPEREGSGSPPPDSGDKDPPS